MSQSRYVRGSYCKEKPELARLTETFLYPPETTDRDHGLRLACDADAARVYRGGSWYESAQRARVAYRLSGGPGSRGANLGFRLVSDEVGK